MLCWQGDARVTQIAFGTVGKDCADSQFVSQFCLENRRKGLSFLSEQTFVGLIN